MSQPNSDTVIENGSTLRRRSCGSNSNFYSLLPHLLQCFLIMFVTGMNDANLGIIIPTLKERYGLTQYVVSIVFLTTTFGYFLAAFINGYLIQKTSQATTALIGALAMVIGFLVIAVSVPFPIMCCMTAFLGFGTALTQSCANVVCGEMPHSTMLLNYSHALYACGALIAPLIAAAVLQLERSWTITYMILCGMGAFNAVTLFFTFRNLSTRAEQQEKQKEQHQKTSSNALITAAIRQRITYVGAFFLLLYVGAEVTLGNWGYTYLISVRSGDTVAMAHIMSGYWAGICAGRLFLGYLTFKLGEKRMVFLYLCLILAMLFVFWFVDAVAASAAALAIIGVALGPLYPSTVGLANKVIPTHLYAVSVGFLSAFGSCGSALGPLITGVMIGAKGVRVLVPFCVAMLGAMIVAWIFMPSSASSSDKDQASGNPPASNESSIIGIDSYRMDTRSSIV
ncbi:hypothetical protein LRAMOSA09775 [Lichtheimia ramosa]|uniref:Major facilitator superfamily (MFS) profile domain-containing protein n=1 Tax=Lichtheimia ramosa TaxID=688394 RepID=A0A077WMM0_9FUNG|nr:hypothetical protein LRAMOSA09775 [Lichtheimia ramosa]